MRTRGSYSQMLMGKTLSLASLQSRRGGDRRPVEHTQEWFDHVEKVARKIGKILPFAANIDEVGLILKCSPQQFAAVRERENIEKWHTEVKRVYCYSAHKEHLSRERIRRLLARRSEWLQCFDKPGKTVPSMKANT